jgi:hypothetical protein
VTRFRLIAFALIAVPALAAERAVDVLWNNPANIHSRNLFYGPGGRKDVPTGPYTFLKEDLEGTNPKFTVKDRTGVTWKVKLGEEAQPETVATRLVWAAGYFTDEDYFVRSIEVKGLPEHLHRGEKYVGPNGIVYGARLERRIKGEKKISDWSWDHDMFSGTRELNGLRVMMALINNWDLKDVNNAVYSFGGNERIYAVSDLGACFGSSHRGLTRASSKGNLKAYLDSHFIHNVKDSTVDFSTPGIPNLVHVFELPEFVQRVEMRSVGRNIPVADARWIGHILSRLSDAQIKSAFRAAGYSPADTAAFAAVVEQRIGELTSL